MEEELDWEWQILVYDGDGDLESSQHYAEEPDDICLNNLLSEGVFLECYLLKDDHSKLQFTMGEDPRL